VTGAGSGLGRALACRLARDGWRIALADVNEASCWETLRLVEQAGGGGRIERLDVTDVENWEMLREQLQADWDHLDLLVNNAGVGGSGEIGRFPIDDWEWVINVNMFGGIYGCHTMVDWLKCNPYGSHILNISSFAAIASAPAMSAYNVGKAGMLSLSETLFAELRPHNVGVTVVCPVFFQTNLLANGRFQNDGQRHIAASYMRRARFTADDVADAAVRAVERKKLFVVLGRKAWFYWWCKRWTPTTFLKTVSSGYLRKLRQPKEKGGAGQPVDMQETPPTMQDA